MIVMKNRCSIKNSPRAVRESTSRRSRDRGASPRCYSADIKCRCALSLARCGHPPKIMRSPEKRNMVQCSAKEA